MECDELDEMKISIEGKIEHGKDILTVCFSPENPLLFYAGDDETVTLANLDDCKTQKKFAGHEDYILSVDVNKDGNLLASASFDENVMIWNVRRSEESTKLEADSGWLWFVRFFNEDSTKVISSGRVVKIWDIERKKEIVKLDSEVEKEVYCVDILPDDNTIISGDNKIRIWDFRSGKCVRTCDHRRSEDRYQKDLSDYQHVSGTETVNCIQFNPNTLSLASGGDRSIKIFDFRTFEVLHNFEDHTDVIRSLCFHPSGKYLLSGSNDRTIKVFDLSSSPLKQKVLFSQTQSDFISAVQFSPDGKHFATGTTEVLFWNFPLGRMIWEDIDEDERVNFVVENLLTASSVDDDNLEINGSLFDERKNVLKISVGGIVSLFCLKSFI